MKKSFLRFLFIILVGAVFIAPAFVFGQNNIEKIDGFYMSAHINADGTVGVKERIVYNFASLKRHGIFRTIPIKYKTSLGNQSVKMTGISVTDENAKPLTYETSNEGS